MLGVTAVPPRGESLHRACTETAGVRAVLQPLIQVFLAPGKAQLLLVLLWTLDFGDSDEYDTVLDLNVFMVHNPQQEEMEG